MATKVGRYELEYDKMFDFSAQKTRASVEKSLALLGVECIDVVQVSDLLTEGGSRLCDRKLFM